MRKQSTKKNKIKEDGVMSIDKISKESKENIKIKDESVMSIDNISNQSKENSKIIEEDVTSIDNISNQSTDNSKIKELIQEVQSETKLPTREIRRKDGYYLRRLVRNSSIKEKAQSEIEKYGTIKNVAGDGSCGIYSTMKGLSQVMIDCNMDGNAFREEVYNYVLNNKSSILSNIYFTNRKKKSEELRGMTQNDYIDMNIMQRIWSRYVECIYREIRGTKINKQDRIKDTYPLPNYAKI